MNLTTRNRSRVPFEKKLILNQWLLSLFKVKSFRELAAILKQENLEGLDENNIHQFHHVLAAHFYHLDGLPVQLLLEYDLNIVEHTQQINNNRITRGEAPIVWKYFQYLGLLFAEIYLDRYFNDPEALLQELLEWTHQCNSHVPESDQVALFDENVEAWLQLNKLAFWMATGSGKTLIMHVNSCQYSHYMSKHGKQKKTDRILLLTPNEGLSKQHLEEFYKANIVAQLFDKRASEMYGHKPIEILEVTRLGDEMGDKTVAVEALEGNNLVLVDEGHRGASSGKTGTWIRLRDALCEQGFSFEYSATFGQAIKRDRDLTKTYAKSTLYDYSYRYFYEDGFGKDYQIFNLDRGSQENQLEVYLVACLLSFFQQQLLYQTHEQDFRQFNVEQPLWVFVGGRVVKKWYEKDATDIIQILLFLDRFVTDRPSSMQLIDEVLKKGIRTTSGTNLLEGQFKYLIESGHSSEQIFYESLKLIFNAPAGGRLYVENLKGVTGEMALRLGADNEAFGVVNVGEPDKLAKLCEQHGLAAGEREFSISLFHKINQTNSKIKLLIGSKKFTEGWNSWRVSTMGLMNIGKTEGAQIIQLFGRGVRLKGYNTSLKRSSAGLPDQIQPPAHINVLETLCIFGIKAHYMAQFREFLEDEGLPTDNDSIEFLLPTVKNIGKQNLKTIRLKKTINGIQTDFVEAFRRLGPIPTLVPPDTDDGSATYFRKNPVVINWYPKIDAIKSSGIRGSESDSELNEAKFSEHHIAFLDLQRLYFDLERFKAERGWHNLNISQSAVKELLVDPTWYRLQIPAYELVASSYEKLKQWEEIALSLLKKYTACYYTLYKRQWEQPHLEYRVLDGVDANFFDEYRVLIDRSQEEVVCRLEELRDLIQRRDLEVSTNNGIREILFSQHLYRPLLYFNGQNIQISPVSLNEGECQFVEDLKEFYDTRTSGILETCELYLLRNLSRGRGIGFFEAGNFHPDFILWKLQDNHQTLIFVDPKAIRHLGFNDPKIRFYKTIKEIEQRLGDPDVSLESYIVSNTPSVVMEQLWNVDKKKMEEWHVLFQNEDKKSYIQSMLEG